MKFYIPVCFQKCVEKIQVLLKFHKNNRYFTWRITHIFIITRSVLLGMKNVSDKICRENQNTHFMFSNFCLRKSCWLSDNVEKCGIVGEATGDKIADTHCMLDT
jgi:hypothetical protein